MPYNTLLAYLYQLLVLLVQLHISQMFYYIKLLIFCSCFSRCLSWLCSWPTPFYNLLASFQSSYLESWPFTVVQITPSFISVPLPFQPFHYLRYFLASTMSRSSTISNLGVIFEHSLTFMSHISSFTKTAFSPM